MARTKGSESGTTMSFDQFWSWLEAHPNCIVRAGTPEAVLYDDEDLHWHFSAEDEETMLVQLMRGKKIVGEIIVYSPEIAYVHVDAQAGEEHVFELVSEGESERVTTYHFVLAHGFDAEEPVQRGRAMH